MLKGSRKNKMSVHILFFLGANSKSLFYNRLFEFGSPGGTRTIISEIVQIISLNSINPKVVTMRKKIRCGDGRYFRNIRCSLGWASERRLELNSSLLPVPHPWLRTVIQAPESPNNFNLVSIDNYCKLKKPIVFTPI